MISRRRFVAGSLGLASAACALRPGGARSASVAVAAGGRGALEAPGWFVRSDLDFPRLSARAAASRKHLAVLWSQRTCSKCKLMLTVNFADPGVRAFVAERFDIVLLDLWGERDVATFDGGIVPERALARRWRIAGTPTLQFFGQTFAEQARAAPPGSPPIADVAEVARVPGYVEPPRFLSLFTYVHERAYETTDLQSYLALTHPDPTT